MAIGTTAALILGGSALAGAGASVYAGSQQAGAARDASAAQVAASQEANRLNKYMYDQTRADFTPYRQVGTNALLQINDLLGIPRAGGGTPVNALMAPGGAPAPQGNPEADTLAQIRSGLQAWEQSLPGNAAPIIQMIDGGASLQNVQAALNSLRATTTNSRNTAFLDPLIQKASDFSGGYGQIDYGNGVSTPVGTAPASAAFDNSPAGIQARRDAAFSSFRADPGYEFALEQGGKSLERSAAARGILNSGATARALTKFGQGLADQQYGNYFNRLQSAAGIGQSATNSTAGAGARYAEGSGNALMAGGAARASGYLGAGSAWANAAGGVAGSIGQGVENYFLLNALNRRGGGGYDGGSAFAAAPYNSFWG